MVCFVLATTVGIMVFSIFEHVYKIKPLENKYIPVKELGKLLSRLDDNLSVDVYFGLEDVSLLNQLIKFLDSHTTISNKYQIFIRSCMVTSITDEKIFSNYNVFLSCNLPKIILINAKQLNSTNSKQSFVIRSSISGDFEYIEIDSEDEITLTLMDNFFAHVKSIRLSDLFMSKTMNYIFETNCSTLSNLADKKCLEINSRDAFFKYMTDILKNCTSNIYAIDFIEPKYWLEHIYTREYGLAHKNVNSKTKQRIHIIDLDKIKKLSDKEKKELVNIYSDYISFMKNECGVDLFFLNLDNFDSERYEKRGSLILENECVFVAINPSVGAPKGEIDFNLATINRYIDRFNDCKKYAEPADDYYRNTLSKI